MFLCGHRFLKVIVIVVGLFTLNRLSLFPFIDIVLLVSLLAIHLLFLVSDDQYNDKYSYQNYLGLKLPKNKLSPTANPMIKNFLSSYSVDY